MFACVLLYQQCKTLLFFKSSHLKMPNCLSCMVLGSTPEVATPKAKIPTGCHFNEMWIGGDFIHLSVGDSKILYVWWMWLLFSLFHLIFQPWKQQQLALEDYTTFLHWNVCQFTNDLYRKYRQRFSYVLCNCL